MSGTLSKLLPLLLCVTPLAAQERVVEVRLTDEMLDSLDALADGATVETVRCLLGSERNDTLFVDLIYEPYLEDATSDSVQAGPCPNATIVVWHNHIFQPERGDTNPEQRCFLSPTDVMTALRSSVFLWAVQVTREVTCWWTRQQIAILAQRYPVVWPIDGQIGRVPRSKP